MRTSVAILSLMSAAALASPIAKAQYGTGVVADECAVTLCLQVLCSSDDYSACLCQNAAELACKEKCPTYNPLEKYCKRQDVPSEGDEYGVTPSNDDEEAHEKTLSYLDDSDDTETHNGGDEEKDGEGEDETGTPSEETGDPTNETINPTPETTDPSKENGNNGQTPNNNGQTPNNNGQTTNDGQSTDGPLIDADVNVGSDTDNGGATNNGQTTDYCLIDADLNVGSGSNTSGAKNRCGSLIDVDISILSSSSDDDCGSLIDADVNILRKPANNITPSQTGNSALINIEIEIVRLLDLRVSLLGNNGNGRDSLIDVDVKLNCWMWEHRAGMNEAEGCCIERATASDYIHNQMSKQADINHLLEIKAQLLSVIDVDVTVGSESGSGDSLIDIEVQISHLLDLKVNVLGDNDESLSDEEHDHLIDIDAQIKHLLDLHVGVLRRI
ncbi:hypothetical protein EK21DRAFT_91299 [Setomelanomma holmii]|uniref:Uncharacterized protein n=1 Tax=Setomelanomma holmii TaxID=210430 RepID=A0A9P4H504_9PLEO|nr:hypothetical protein EK21DRAFT_91299 [Setomelanomma holmii]